MVEVKQELIDSTIVSAKENNASKVLRNSGYNKEEKQVGEVIQTDKIENSKNGVVPYN